MEKGAFKLGLGGQGGFSDSYSGIGDHSLFYVCIYYLASQLHQDLASCAGSQLWHVGSLVAACKLLVMAHGIQVPDQGLNHGSLHWELRVLAIGSLSKSFTFLHRAFRKAVRSSWLPVGETPDTAEIGKRGLPTWLWCPGESCLPLKEFGKIPQFRPPPMPGSVGTQTQAWPQGIYNFFGVQN